MNELRNSAAPLSVLAAEGGPAFDTAPVAFARPFDRPRERTCNGTFCRSGIRTGCCQRCAQPAFARRSIEALPPACRETEVDWPIPSPCAAKPAGRTVSEAPGSTCIAEAVAESACRSPFVRRWRRSSRAFAPPAAPEPVPVAFAGAPAPRIASADLSELSPVELVERMALSLQRRRRPLPAPAAPVQTSSSSFGSRRRPGRGGDGRAGRSGRIARATDFAGGDASDRFQRIRRKGTTAPVLVPPRSIPMPFQAQAPEEHPAAEANKPAEPEAAAPLFAAPFEPLATIDTAPEEDMAELEGGEQARLEDGYSSLLDLGRPVAQRQHFVRIEEPEAEIGAVEPVVIFPGRAARTETRFGAPAPALGRRTARCRGCAGRPGRTSRRGPTRHPPVRFARRAGEPGQPRLRRAIRRKPSALCAVRLRRFSG